VVIGIQNSPGSTLMTVADMSVITAEVRVDETDIVNVRLGQSADVTIDAFPRQVFKAVVTEIGDNALVRSTAWPLRRASDPARKPKISRSRSRSPAAAQSSARPVDDGENHHRDQPEGSDHSDPSFDHARSIGLGGREGQEGIDECRQARQEERDARRLRDPRQEIEIRARGNGIAGATDIEVKGGLQEATKLLLAATRCSAPCARAWSQIDNAAPKKEEEAS